MYCTSYIVHLLGNLKIRIPKIKMYKELLAWYQIQELSILFLPTTFIQSWSWSHHQSCWYQQNYGCIVLSRVYLSCIHRRTGKRIYPSAELLTAYGRINPFYEVMYHKIGLFISKFFYEHYVHDRTSSACQG